MTSTTRLTLTTVAAFMLAALTLTAQSAPTTGQPLSSVCVWATPTSAPTCYTAAQTATPAQAPAVAASAEPLLDSSSLTEIGAFRLPSGSTNQTSFSYGGTALTYRGDTNTLLMIGHDWYQLAAEVSIPTPVHSAKLTDLPVATLVQPFTDVLQGHLHDIGTGTAKVGGLLPFHGKLIATAYLYYDGGGLQTKSHFITGLNFAALPPIAGPLAVPNAFDKAGVVAGWMGPVPTEWQTALGGDLATGQCCIPVIGRSSYGPSMTILTGDQLGGSAPLVTSTVLGYTQANPLGDWGTANGLFNGTTTIGGFTFVPGTRSVLYLGRQGTTYCYGIGTGDQVLGSTAGYCYDPTASAKGDHGYPYITQVWAYDLNDLAAVKAGQKQPWDVKPYAIWTIPDTLPQAPQHLIGGVVYDPGTHRLYLSAEYENGAAPLIQVFQVSVPGQP
jgi:hypothetical protein